MLIGTNQRVCEHYRLNENNIEYRVDCAHCVQPQQRPLLSHIRHEKWKFCLLPYITERKSNRYSASHHGSINLPPHKNPYRRKIRRRAIFCEKFHTSWENHIYVYGYMAYGCTKLMFVDNYRTIATREYYVYTETFIVLFTTGNKREFARKLCRNSRMMVLLTYGYEWTC